MSYADFLRNKFVAHQPTGIVSPPAMPSGMFPHQSALTMWALKRGRAAIFADTGLGKMLMELVWADAVNAYTSMPVMIHTPLAVAAQIAREGARFRHELLDLAAVLIRLHDSMIPGSAVLDRSRK